MFQDLLEALNRLPLVTVHSTSLLDFCDYDQPMKDLYQMQSCRIKINHIFSFTDDGSQMTLQKSNLMEHTEFMFNLCKKGM
jgi:hypothetical protein